MNKEVIFIALVLLVYLCGAAWFDLKHGKIRNYYIVFGIVLATLLRGMVLTLSSCISIVLGSFILFILLYPFFKIGTIGAGDIKLLIVCVWFLNAKMGFLITIGAFIIGAIVSVIKMIRYHEFGNRMHYLWRYVCEVMESKTIRPYESATKTEKNDTYQMETYKIHFSIPIVLSAAWIMLFIQ